MGSLGKREKILLGILAAVLVFLAYYSLFLSPVIDRTNELNQSIGKAKVQVDRIRNAKEIIKNQKALIEELEDKLNLSLKAIPETERNPEIAFNMKKFADQNKLYFSTISFSKIIDIDEWKKERDKKENNKDANKNTQENTTKKSSEETTSDKKIIIVPITITTEGDYNTTMNYIASIEKDPRIAVVYSIEMKSDTKTGKIKADTSVALLYSNKVSDKALDYDFNQGIYGKGDLFK